ncbi:hypothetical protein BX616_010286 [Lobosporangium transversale]|uniref:F-box domain-containing protein n=1 Tax=Lobosporangium transversale TaxID=64571 RepID=A0A1Y2GKG9_9FUNG|nr:hypothetical protein BCR41DRAFT_398360 [Lobosporangium transversale]KAF9912644.1 hypothetical protein BX616_010286 [Lobosporangium transversale]ORZ10265.1 hypothetical protein BCR41DRAFT_398360 [Lobosporangium transversale]|eukprot:XP_021879172.1 hypothetical protein BCR41DRAFT_398360 [Lobosporangium transversale]
MSKIQNSEATETKSMVESLQWNPKTPILFSPLSISTSLPILTHAAIRPSSPSSLSSLSSSSSSSSSSRSSLSSLPSRSSVTKALVRSKRHSHSKKNNSIPYYACCFSPLSLPSDIFVYLLEFLSPVDLWRLCQVSRAMQMEVVGFMSKVQRLKYEAVRILHQENSETDPELQAQRQYTFYERMTFGAARRPSSSSLRMSFSTRSKTPGKALTRSSYWLAQARLLVAAITADTKYEPKSESSPAKQEVCTQINREMERFSVESLSSSPSSGSTSSFLSTSPVSLSDSTQSDTQEPSSISGTWSSFTGLHSPSQEAATSVGAQSSAAPTSYQGVHHAPSASLISHRFSAVDIPSLKGDLETIPMDRFETMVDLIFDPNIVQLNHRRAIINCARYVSASIDETFSKAVNTQTPQNPTFHTAFLSQHTVYTGPYLTIFTPVLYDGEGHELSPTQRALTGGTKSLTIAPPRRLHNYFQMMLWYRCLSDLISLYNRIQDRHIDHVLNSQQSSTDTIEAGSYLTSNAVCCQESTLLRENNSLPSDLSAVYPFCCKAHSLIFTTQYPSSIVSYSIRTQLRRIVRKVQAVSQKGSWSSAFSGLVFTQDERSLATTPSTPRRSIQYTGPTKKLHLCDRLYGYQRQQQEQQQNRRGSRREEEERELEQRRYRVEETARQDNLTRQELLALCHMACGLFLANEQSVDAPPTIMSLLRQGSPWVKGVWRDGEWKHDSIDLQQPGSNQQKTNSSNSNSNNDQSFVSVGSDKDMGKWQKLCLSTIQFLAHEELSWGGNRTNSELSRLRATSNPTTWVYHE